MTATSLPAPGDVHRYWFGAFDDWSECAAANGARWFADGRKQDAAVRQRFSGLVAAAARGELAHWCRHPRDALALVITLDQFPRHIHRGSPEAFACDPKAQAVCLSGIDAGQDRALSPVERSFFYLPLEHAEDPDAQQRCVGLMRDLAAGSPPQLQRFTGDALRFAEQHRDIISRFGRFPHRNGVLGRASTAAEQAWLAGGGARFGQ